MKLLFLRGQIPQDRDPKEIVFEDIEDCDDMWTQLAYKLSDGDYSELWYWGGSRKHHFAENFVERWVPNFKKYNATFTPDVIFCRGGFKEYHHVLNRCPNSIKIYYGAGRRYLPQDGFKKYDLILQDSKQQLDKCKSKYPNIESCLFIKPAADNIFHAVDCDKEYDVCFPANGAQTFKGHKFVYETVPSDIKLLNIGNNPHNFKYPSNVSSFKCKRSEIASHISKCKVGIVAVNSSIDSCPRVIPEMLACNIPIVVSEGVRFWEEKYITVQTGFIANKEKFWEKVKYVLDNMDQFSPQEYYENNLSIEKASAFLIKKINILYNNKMKYEIDKEEFEFDESIIYPKDPTATKKRISEYKEYYKIKYAICKQQNPKVIAEIGVRAGYSAWSFLQAAPKAVYIGFDANNGKHGGAGGKSGEFARWADKILEPYWHELIDLDTQTVDELPVPVDPPNVDLFHVDGDHTKNGVMHDLDLAFKVISPSGLILVDDITYLDRVKAGVYKWLNIHKDEAVGEFIPSLRGEMLIRKKQ